MDKGMFLDRDGVINEVLTQRVKFVNKPGDFYLLDGVGEAIKAFNDMGFRVFVVTNQGGIGLGYMTEDSLTAIHNKMADDLAQYGAVIDDIAYCPHKPHAGCPCRKPKPQMILDLAEKHVVDPGQSYMVGDREPDIEAGRQAGTTTVLVGAKDRHTAEPDKHFPNLLTFASWLKKHL
ncbi:D-glycero-alpha-D-manno-heptose-1,7-bisphosphate 7-phosphatase [Lentibacillus salinarum]|uniref:D,D-heptose 1,7-bisphosphate phosphatase n=1 Tax=Lentibacillus salinarum TaxID=446820 RepID=A0ABW3ZWU1_9BACI